MVCGGFTCTRSMLAMLNVFYIVVAFILIGVAAYAKAMAVIATIHVMGGIIACGVFLLMVAIVGLIGAVKHHQVLLFFYMIILFLLFIVQFAVACAALALSDAQQSDLYVSGWMSASYDLKQTTQRLFGCCGCNRDNQGSVIQSGDTVASLGHPSCASLPCCKDKNSTNPCCASQSNIPANNNVTTTIASASCLCEACWTVIEAQLHQAVKFVGIIGLLFSFTEIVGIFLAFRYRNLKDPRANPGAFL